MKSSSTKKTKKILLNEIFFYKVISFADEYEAWQGQEVTQKYIVGQLHVEDQHRVYLVKVWAVVKAIILVYYV